HCLLTVFALWSIDDQCRFRQTVPVENTVVKRCGGTQRGMRPVKFGCDRTKCSRVRRCQNPKTVDTKWIGGTRPMHLDGNHKGKRGPHFPRRRSGVQGPTDTTEGLFFSVRRPERHIRGSASWKVFCARLCPRSAFTTQSRSTESYDRNEPPHAYVAHCHVSRSPPNGIANLGHKEDRMGTANVSLWGTVRENLGLLEAECLECLFFLTLLDVRWMSIVPSERAE
ncbi:hypothetical protein GOODEAATRI_028347, partial [Goodea atripinnis]